MLNNLPLLPSELFTLYQNRNTVSRTHCSRLGMQLGGRTLAEHRRGPGSDPQDCSVTTRDKVSVSSEGANTVVAENAAASEHGFRLEVNVLMTVFLPPIPTA